MEQKSGFIVRNSELEIREASHTQVQEMLRNKYAATNGMDLHRVSMRVRYSFIDGYVVWKP